MSDFSELLKEKLAPFCALSAAQVEELAAHARLLLKWNSRMNLTAVRDEEEIVERHYCESVALALTLPEEPVSVVDIGTGAGFPGFPVAVVRPDCRVLLVESNQRKAVFLRESARGRSNVSVLAQRAEELDTRYDWLVSRAVNPVQLVSLAPTLASSVALMVGEDDIPALLETPHVEWSSFLRLPWGKRRLILSGHVPRGTI